jgi:hypothetical protein
MGITSGPKSSWARRYFSSPIFLLSCDGGPGELKTPSGPGFSCRFNGKKRLLGHNRSRGRLNIRV